MVFFTSSVIIGKLDTLFRNESEQLPKYFKTQSFIKKYKSFLPVKILCLPLRAFLQQQLADILATRKRYAYFCELKTQEIFIFIRKRIARRLPRYMRGLQSFPFLRIWFFLRPSTHKAWHSSPRFRCVRHHCRPWTAVRHLKFHQTLYNRLLQGV